MMIRPLVFAAVLAGVTSPAVAAGDPANGAALFRGRCAACHSAIAATPKPSAPTLAGVVGRKAASLGGARYSAALKASGLVWTPPTLERYLADPRTVVPGGMMLVKLSQPQDRADMIAYLATLKGTPAR